MSRVLKEAVETSISIFTIMFSIGIAFGVMALLGLGVAALINKGCGS